MGDLALLWDSGEFDLSIDSSTDDLVGDDGLRTAVILSLYIDARAGDDDEITDGTDDLRGCWFDEFLSPDGGYGSKSWLVIERGKITESAMREIEAHDADALQWMIDDHVARDVSVIVSSDGDSIVREVTITRPSGTDVRFRFSAQWQAEISR